jgi:hypothetical protein
MKSKSKTVIAAFAAMAFTATSALAAGELQVFNWGD